MGREHQFINPYNFIPLGEHCIRENSKDEKTYTGYIDCELTTKTPIIINDTNIVLPDSEVKDHKVYPETIKIEGVPIIPGSELRGMIRSKFEALTNSCMSSVQENLSFYGRYNGNMRNPGILDFTDKKNVKLYSCKKIEIGSFDIQRFNRYNTGQFMTFDSKIIYVKGRKKEIFSKFNNQGKYKGYFKKGEVFGKRGSAMHIFVIEEELTGLVNQNDFKDMYEELIETFKEDNGRHHASYSSVNYKPVWYEIVDNYVYFSLGQNGQTKFRNRLKDVINKEYLPCKDIDHLCEACDVFGTVQKDIASSSKVRVEDAYMVNPNQNYYAVSKPITLSELSSPKYANAPFYLIQYDEDGWGKTSTQKVWNVDFESVFNMKKNQTFYFEPGDIGIRGRKEYWHFRPNLNMEVEKTKRNVSVKPIKENVKYSFKIYFDGITEKQLEHLNMAISLGNNSDFSHKVGLGKPLGFGSVKIQTKEIICKDITYQDGKVQYTLKPYITKSKTILDAFSELKKDPYQYAAIKALYSFSYIDSNDLVDYPRNYPNGKIFEWFEANKKRKGKEGKQTLPFAEDDYDSLIQVGFDNRNNNRNNYKKNRR